MCLVKVWVLFLILIVGKCCNCVFVSGFLMFVSGWFVVMIKCYCIDFKGLRLKVFVSVLVFVMLIVSEKFLYNSEF